MSKFAAGILTGLLLAVWALMSPRHLRALADRIEETDQERDVRIALKAIGLFARQRATEERRSKTDSSATEGSGHGDG